ncbi:MAG TPA: molybdopterin-binding protein [Desulfobacteraceae bacterium]|nr:molybdopterin-binding protein [Desulfobacteraceae bacterium]HPJ68922.1 molybdopterin-binding protein [Desulfobacteraceae bacterium]HPQ27896.1 molybdopterin-binding protein [Desulfobacteraceae bacterium]
MSNKYKSSAKSIPIEQAVGTVLAHDVTEIIPGQFKGPAFKKGHIITEEDLLHLRRVGKEHLFVLHLDPGEVHEDDAAVRLCTAFAGTGVVFDPKPSEGKISLKASHRGLLKVNIDALIEVNLVPDISCSSRHNNTLVEKNDIVAAARAIPLVIEEKILNAAVKIAEDADGIFSVKPLSRPKISLVVTGKEVYTGLIEDKFAPVVKKKLEFFDCEINDISFVPDDKIKIVTKIQELLQNDAELIMVTGGMSVDPDDITRMAIYEAGARDIVYGTPVLPGAMFLYGRFGSVPVLGLPGCVLFYRATIFDLILPRVLAGESLTRKDIALMAHGGMCYNCDVCRYPLCPFGK